jgi:hypothetical protein
MINSYIEAHIANGFILGLSSLVAAPVVFANRQDGELKLSVDHCPFSLVTVKNLYPLVLIAEMLDCMHEAQMLVKLDLHSVYNLIRIKTGD